MTIRRFGPRSILIALAAILVIVTLVTPEAPAASEGGRSTYSVGPGGARIAYDLARRMGWHVERRTTELDSAPTETTVQAVLAPSGALGAHEVHRLLTNVRRGGGLIFTLDGGDEIADSLGLRGGRPGRLLAGYGSQECRTPSSLSDRVALAFPQQFDEIVWRRPPPGPIVPLVMSLEGINTAFQVGVGFPLGAGKVAVIGGSSVIANEAVRLCGLAADVAVARLFEYVRPPAGGPARLVFDEFHHGFGMHGGSAGAVVGYLAGTPSGHFLAQALLAGLVLVLALAPRPVPPRDPERVVRRSPLEHADALGSAYADVGATRTAAARLVSGLRRRAGRIVAVSGGASDEVFLDAVANRYPVLAEPVAIVRRALVDAVSARDLVSVGTALRDIEHHITTSPSLRT